MTTRREFLGAVGVAAGAVLAFERAAEALERAGRHAGPDEPPEVVCSNEDFWFEVGQAFTVDRSLVNLNNGGVSPTPAFVLEAMKRHLDFSNQAPTYAMWEILEPRREVVRARLAAAFGCDAEEVALTRNASEGLQTVQLGLDLEAGDEVLTTTQDYPRMLNTFRQRERREGIRVTQIRIPIPAEDPAEVVALFERAITPRTRAILICHVVNITGQILPVREVARMAHERGVPVIVDGAHSFAHLDFKISDLECEYFAASLHKWLFAPHGTGILVVRRDRIAPLWPLMAAPEAKDDDIRKFEEIGTHPAAPYLAVAEALTFHQGIGAARKEARLRYLRDYWATRLLAHPGVRLHTSLKPSCSCGLGTVELVGVPTRDLATWLWKQHRIIVAPIVHDEFQGIRVTPSVYTTLEELDRFVAAMEHVRAHGLPA